MLRARLSCLVKIAVNLCSPKNQEGVKVLHGAVPLPRAADQLNNYV
jgi:hypothetical protein